MAAAPLKVCADVADPVALLAMVLWWGLKLNPFLFLFSARFRLSACYDASRACLRHHEGGASILFLVGNLRFVNIWGPVLYYRRSRGYILRPVRNWLVVTSIFLLFVLCCKTGGASTNIVLSIPIVFWS